MTYSWLLTPHQVPLPHTLISPLRGSRVLASCSPKEPSMSVIHDWLDVRCCLDWWLWPVHANNFHMPAPLQMSIPAYAVAEFRQGSGSSSWWGWRATRTSSSSGPRSSAIPWTLSASLAAPDKFQSLILKAFTTCLPNTHSLIGQMAAVGR